MTLVCIICKKSHIDPETGERSDWACYTVISKDGSLKPAELVPHDVDVESIATGTLCMICGDRIRNGWPWLPLSGESGAMKKAAKCTAFREEAATDLPSRHALNEMGIQDQTVGRLLQTLAAIKSNQVWISVPEFVSAFGRSPSETIPPIPIRVELNEFGIREKGCVLRDPNHPFRAYERTGFAGH